jgi:hypothetical protein
MRALIALALATCTGSGQTAAAARKWSRTGAQLGQESPRLGAQGAGRAAQCSLAWSDRQDEPRQGRACTYRQHAMHQHRLEGRPQLTLIQVLHQFRLYRSKGGGRLLRKNYEM